MKAFWWTIAAAALCVGAVGFLSCSSDVSGIFTSPGAYQFFYEFDNRSASCVDGRPTFPDGSVNPNFGEPCDVPAAGSNTLRLELEKTEGSNAVFALRAYGFTLSDVMRLNFTLQFNPLLFEYIYPPGNSNPRAPDYPGARPSALEGLSGAGCSGCCIEWTDLSCTQTGGGKDPQATACRNPSRKAVSICVKRSCTPSGPPGPAPNHACGVECCTTPPSNPCSEDNSNNCRAFQDTDARAECVNNPPGNTLGCHNSCNEPLVTHTAGADELRPPRFLCCIEEITPKNEKGNCPAISGIAPDKAVFFIPLRGFSARTWDDFKFLFSVASGSSVGSVGNYTYCCGSSTVVPASEDPCPDPCITWITGAGTIALAQPQ
jgi:hypothetical protein